MVGKSTSPLLLISDFYVCNVVRVQLQLFQGQALQKWWILTVSVKNRMLQNEMEFYRIPRSTYL